MLLFCLWKQTIVFCCGFSCQAALAQSKVSKKCVLAFKATGLWWRLHVEPFSCLQCLYSLLFRAIKSLSSLILGPFLPLTQWRGWSASLPAGQPYLVHCDREFNSCSWNPLKIVCMLFASIYSSLTKQKTPLSGETTNHMHPPCRSHGQRIQPRAATVAPEPQPLAGKPQTPQRRRTSQWQTWLRWLMWL